VYRTGYSLLIAAIGRERPFGSHDQHEQVAPAAFFDTGQYMAVPFSFDWECIILAITEDGDVLFQQ
jgi:hypothetical protein